MEKLYLYSVAVLFLVEIRIPKREKEQIFNEEAYLMVLWKNQGKIKEKIAVDSNISPHTSRMDHDLRTMFFVRSSKFAVFSILIASLGLMLLLFSLSTL